MRDSTLPSPALSLGEASEHATAARANLRRDQLAQHGRMAKHSQDLLAAQAVLLPLVLLASAAGSAALILISPRVEWPHPVIVAQIALAIAQLGALSLFAVLVPRSRMLSVTAMFALAFIWSKCLGHVELDFARWAMLMVSLTLPPIAVLALLRWRGLRLLVRKQQHAESQTQHFKAGERSPWQFSLGSLLALTTLITIALSGLRVLYFEWRSHSSAAQLPDVEVTLAALPLISLSLMFLLLGGAGQRRWYYGVTALLTLAAVACLGASLTAAFSAPVPHVWTLQLYACYGMFAGGYLVIARQCGARLIWRREYSPQAEVAADSAA